MSIWKHIEGQISEAVGQSFSIQENQSLGGGSINQACKVSDDQSSYFVKINAIQHKKMFAAEAEGLREMSAVEAVRVPVPVTHGEYAQQCFIVMEYLELGGSTDTHTLGQLLAAMHKVTSGQFGWKMDNTIGSTPQINTWCDNWIDFWREQRLGPQLMLAAGNGYGGVLQRTGERLLSEFPSLFESYSPKPSMLHGDLWSGNYGGLADSEPVIFDPAFYYGDRETDLAMTTLFGGFSADFYAAYNDVWQLDEGYAVRKTFYNVYHIINHLNLFGGGYQSQAINMMEQVLAEI